MSLVTVVVLAIFVLPKFEDFFASLDAELPLPTRMLLAITGFLSACWWLLARRSPSWSLAGLRRSADRSRAGAPGTGLLLRLPVIGETVRYAHRRALLPDPLLDGSAPASPLPEAMRVATRERWATSSSTAGSPRRPTRCSRAPAWPRPIAGDRSCSPATARQMIRVGEETGTLDTQLEVAAAVLRARARLQDQEGHRAHRARRASS